MKIGFIGLGIMGRPMCKNLLAAKNQLVVYDVTEMAMEEVVNAGAQAAASPKDVAMQCTTVITMLPNSPHVRTVCLGENGLLKGLQSGSTLIDMSSISPMVSREIAQILTQNGVAMLDAPVSGGEPKAVDGSLSIMVGGDPSVFERYKDLLHQMGTSVTYCGEIGAGNTTKLANQIIVALNIAAVAEALVFSKKVGVDPAVVFQAIRGGLAGGTVLDAKAPMMLKGSYEPGFRIDLHYKDLTNVLETARELNVPIPFSSQVYEILKYLRNEQKGQNDHSGMVTYFETLAHITLHDPDQ